MPASARLLSAVCFDSCFVVAPSAGLCEEEEGRQFIPHEEAM